MGLWFRVRVRARARAGLGLVLTLTLTLTHNLTLTLTLTLRPEFTFDEAHANVMLRALRLVSCRKRPVYIR